MQVTKIYMDLQEAKPEKKQGKDVWVLESEAFKDPITLQVEFDGKDQKYLESIKQEVESQKKEMERMLKKSEEMLNQRKEESKKYREECQEKDEEIKKLQEKILKEQKKKSKEQQQTEKISDTVDKINEQVKALQIKYIDLEQIVTKETRVFSGQTFVSGNGISALTAIRVPDGNYAVIWMTKIVEKNEYVENDDHEVGAMYVHVQDGIFTPEYDLQGTTNLDTPTATVNRTFIMIPN